MKALHTPGFGRVANSSGIALICRAFHHLLFARNGALLTSDENYVDTITSIWEAQLAKDNADRVFVKIKPRLIGARIFSKAPIGRQT